MQLLYRGIGAYLLIAAVFCAVVLDDPVAAFAELLGELPASGAFFLSLGWWVPALIGLALGLGVAGLPAKVRAVRLKRAAGVAVLTLLFFGAFSLAKSAFPAALPFWADPALATIDRALHVGADPWVLSHRLGIGLDPDTANRIYLASWLVMAMGLPVFLALFDGNAARVRRFTWLYFLVWVGLGTLMALGFLSAGPIYYDRVVGGARFAELTEALERAGVTASSVGTTQERLWQAYLTGSRAAGASLSAFPSVHIAMVTLVGLYGAERHWLLAPIGAALVVYFVHLSVYFGWHYAVDGYGSILIVVLAWAALRRRAAAM